MIWNEAKECMSRDEMMTLQSKRLVKVVDRVYHNVEYYRKKMQQVGIEPGDINGIATITAGAAAINSPVTYLWKRRGSS